MLQQHAIYISNLTTNKQKLTSFLYLLNANQLHETILICCQLYHKKYISLRFEMKLNDITCKKNVFGNFFCKASAIKCSMNVWTEAPIQ